METQTVIPVGAIVHDSGISVIKLSQQFNKALLNLKLFSHILVVTAQAITEHGLR